MVQYARCGVVYLFSLAAACEEVWVLDSTPPTVYTSFAEATDDETIHVKLQLNEPGTIWCALRISPHSRGLVRDDFTTSVGIVSERSASQSANLRGWLRWCSPQGKSMIEAGTVVVFRCSL